MSDVNVIAVWVLTVETSNGNWTSVHATEDDAYAALRANFDQLGEYDGQSETDLIEGLAEHSGEYAEIGLQYIDASLCERVEAEK